MKKYFKALFFFFAVSSLFPQVPIYKPPPAFKWLDSLEEGKKAAKEKSKPLLVFYYLDEDKDSQWFLKIGFENKDVKETLKEFVGVKLNATKEPRILNYYPSILFYSPSGREILLSRITSRIDEDQINATLGVVLTKTVYISNSKFEKIASVLRKQFRQGEKIALKCAPVERGYSTVRVLDAQGNLVKTLFRGVKKPGDIFLVDWDQKDLEGNQVSAGEYVFSVELSSYKDMVEVLIQ